MKRLIDYVRGTVILHNFLRNDDDWVQMDLDEFVDNALQPEANAPSNQADYTRRDELYFYLSKLPDTTIN